MCALLATVFATLVYFYIFLSYILRVYLFRIIIYPDYIIYLILN
jgi:hypothetical protein